MEFKQYCPICEKVVENNQRHPNYICVDCTAKVTDKNGRYLKFANVDMAGGYQAWYVDTQVSYDSHICYIEGVKCYADEHRFGGIVIEKLTE